MIKHPLSNGISIFIEQERSVASLPWNHHPIYPGVSMKHLITGAETVGQLSLHLVRIAPGHAINEHRHSTQWELHQVLGGTGEATLEGKRINYASGTVCTIPIGKRHEVFAGGDGMLLLATFSPPLV
jgi:quercetin dioxygenase-like cupin family protein